MQLAAPMLSSAAGVNPEGQSSLKKVKISAIASHHFDITLLMRTPEEDADPVHCRFTPANEAARIPVDRVDAPASTLLGGCH